VAMAVVERGVAEVFMGQAGDGGSSPVEAL
jgi:hypothetical protein